jgi:hypothetical protein
MFKCQFLPHRKHFYGTEKQLLILFCVKSYETYKGQFNVEPYGSHSERPTVKVYMMFYANLLSLNRILIYGENAMKVF